MAFITQCWEVVRYDVVAAVRNFYGQGVSETFFVALIPKKVGASELRDLRPIRLIGCIYKIISKLD